MSDPLPPRRDRDQGRLAGDEVPRAMEVLAVDRGRGRAVCGGAGETVAEVETALIAPVAPGEMLLVHAGTAVGRPA